MKNGRLRPGVFDLGYQTNEIRAVYHHDLVIYGHRFVGPRLSYLLILLYNHTFLSPPLLLVCILAYL